MFRMEFKDVHSEINHAVGDELRAARARRRLSRAQLANKSGLAVSTIQRFENGERSPDILQLQTLSDALEISPLDIVRKSVEVNGKWTDHSSV